MKFVSFWPKSRKLFVSYCNPKQTTQKLPTDNNNNKFSPSVEPVHLIQSEVCDFDRTGLKMLYSAQFFRGERKILIPFILSKTLKGEKRA